VATGLARMALLASVIEGVWSDIAGGERSLSGYVTPVVRGCQEALEVLPQGIREGLDKSIEGLVSPSSVRHMSGLAHAFIKC